MGSLLWTSLYSMWVFDTKDNSSNRLTRNHGLNATLENGTVTTLGLPQNSQSRCDLCRMHWTGSVHMSKHLQQTNRVKKHVGRDYSSINTASNTVAGSQESFGKVTSKTNAPHNLFFPSFMIRLENNVLRAESSLTASCVVSYYVYWSLWTDISKPPNVFSLGPRLESLHIDKNQQRSDSRRLTPTTTSLSDTFSGMEV